MSCTPYIRSVYAVHAWSWHGTPRDQTPCHSPNATGQYPCGARPDPPVRRLSTDAPPKGCCPGQSVAHCAAIAGRVRMFSATLRSETVTASCRKPAAEVTFVSVGGRRTAHLDRRAGLSRRGNGAPALDNQVLRQLLGVFHSLDCPARRRAARNFPRPGALISGRRRCWCQCFL